VASRTGSLVKKPAMSLSRRTELAPIQFARATGSPLCNASKTTDLQCSIRDEMESFDLLRERHGWGMKRKSALTRGAATGPDRTAREYHQPEELDHSNSTITGFLPQASQQSARLGFHPWEPQLGCLVSSFASPVPSLEVGRCANPYDRKLFALALYFASVVTSHRVQGIVLAPRAREKYQRSSAEVWNADEKRCL
jgi:hypothetical protein